LQPDPFPTPPPWAWRFRSDDLDEVRAAVAQTAGEHSRVVHRAGPLGFAMDLLFGQTISVGWGRAALDTTVRGSLAHATLHLAMPPGSVYRVGRREHIAGPRAAMFLAPGWSFTRRSPPGAMLALGLDNEDRLLGEIAARRRIVRGRPLLTTRSLVIDDFARSRLVAALIDVVRSKEPGVDPRASEHAEAGLVAAVADLLLAQSAAVPVQAAATARIAQVEEWIEANLERPITSGQLCQVANVGQRALEKIFESRRGMSPMRFVTERRLAAALRALSRGTPDEDVTRVALGLGFGHMGRFAALYLRVYGESPSQTLARARRSRGAGPTT
jgi:AraC-like DNA-binding protein